MTLLIILAVLTALAFLPLGFRAVYRQSQPGVWVRIGPLKFRVYPGKNKEKNRKDASPKEKIEKSSKSEDKVKKGGSWQDFLPVVKTILEFLEQFRRKLRVNNLELKLTLAGDDPCDLAVNYGRSWAALGSLIPQLERFLVIRKQAVEVQCDFTADKTCVYACLDATITLARAVHLLSRHGIKVIKDLLKLKKLRKGGAQL